MTHVRGAVRRGTVITALTVTAVAAGGTAAQAHPVLEASTPTSGATLATAPSVLLLDYGQKVEVRGQFLAGPGGTTVPLEPPTVADDLVAQALPALSQPGEYTFAFDVRGQDGDVVKETLRFTLAPTATADGPPPAADEKPQTDIPDAANSEPTAVHPLLLWVLGLSVLVLAGAGIAVLVIAAAAGWRAVS